MGVSRKWHSTSCGAANLGGVSGDLSEHRGSGITLLGITSLFMHKLTGLQGYCYLSIYVYPNYCLNSVVQCNYIASNLQNSQIEVCFCMLCNMRVDLAKLYYLNSFPIQWNHENLNIYMYQI